MVDAQLDLVGLSSDSATRIKCGFGHARCWKRTTGRSFLIIGALGRALFRPGHTGLAKWPTTPRQRSMRQGFERLESSDIDGRYDRAGVCHRASGPSGPAGSRLHLFRRENRENRRQGGPANLTVARYHDSRRRRGGDGSLHLRRSYATQAY